MKKTNVATRFGYEWNMKHQQIYAEFFYEKKQKPEAGDDIKKIFENKMKRQISYAELYDKIKRPKLDKNSKFSDNKGKVIDVRPLEEQLSNYTNTLK